MTRSTTHHLFLFAIIGIAFGLRLGYLTAPVRFDEAYTFNHFTAQPFLVTLAQYDHWNNHILHTYLTTLVQRAFGSEPMLLRLPAFIAGVLLVPIGYRVAAQLYERRTALITAALLASTLPLVQFSVNARGYTLVTLVGLLLLGQGHRACHHNRSRDWVLFSLLLVVSLIIVPVMFYPALSVVLWLLVTITLEMRGAARKSRLHHLTLATASGLLLVLVFYAPLLYTTNLNAFLSAHRNGDFLAPTDLHRQSSQLPASVIATGFPGLGLFALIGVFLHERTSRRLVPPLVTAMLAVLMTVLTLRTVPEARYWLALLPIIYMTAAAGITNMLDLWRSRAHSNLALVICVALSGWLVITNAVYRSEVTGRVPDAPAAARDLVAIMQPGDTLLTLDPHSEVMRYYLRYYGLPFDPVINPQREPFALGLHQNNIYTLYEDALNNDQATDYITFAASNLSIDVETVATYSENVLEQIIVQSTTPVTTDTRIALFSEDFASGELSDDWTYDPDITTVRRVGQNHVLEIDSDSEWATVTLKEGTLWIDYSLFARVRVLEAGDTKDDIFLHVRHLPPIGSYAGSINPAADIAMLSADFERAWRGPLLPVGVQTMPNRTWQQMRVRAVGNTIALYTNGERLLQARDDTIRRGSIRIVVPPYHRIQIDDIVVIEEVDRALNNALTIDFADEETPLPLTYEPPQAAHIERGALHIEGGDAWAFVRLADEPTFDNVAVQARVKITQPSPETYDFMVLARQDYRGNYAAVVDADTNTVAIGEDRSGIWQGELASTDVTLAPNTWHTLRVQVVDDSIAVLIDDQQVVRTLDTRYTSGGITFAVPPGGAVELNDIRIDTGGAQ